jgi:hypothetical protein
MTSHATHAHAHDRDTVIIVGGRGGLQARYRDAVERIGYQCRCYEDRVSAKCPPSTSKIALVIVLVTMVSHPLLMQARALAGAQERIVYLRSPSVSSVRQTVETMMHDREVRHV